MNKNENKNMNAENPAEVVQPQNEINIGAENTAASAEPQQPFKTFQTAEDWQNEIDRIIGARLKDDRLTREKAEKFERLEEACAANAGANAPQNTGAPTGIDFDEELKSPKFLSLVAEHGISAEDAYYLCHREDLLSRARSAVAADISARRSRIQEAGAQNSRAAASFINPSRLSDSQIDDIFERVQSGEKITF